MDNYDVKNDKEFRKTILFSDIAEKSKETYRKTVEIFCKTNQKPYHEIINEIKEEQHDKIIEGNIIVRYNPNDGIVNEYITQFLDYFRQKGNKQSSLTVREQHIRTILRKSNIDLPDPQIKSKKTHKRKKVLSRSDIQYVIKKSNIHHKALISFTASTGFRINDLVRFTIEDFMEATRDYHNFFEVDEFIENAPYDMIGFWVITPQKTKNIDLECRVCNTPESSNYILDSLTERKDFLEERGMSLDFDDALFSSRKGNYKKHYSYGSMSPLFTRKNKVLFKHKKKLLTEDYKKQKISRKEYNEQLNDMPRFHAHALRHFFTTTLRAYTTNRDVSLIMEGHTSPYEMDKHYVGENDEMFSDDVIKDTYFDVIDYLTFSNNLDVDRYLELKQVEKEFNKNVKKTEELENKYNELNDLLMSMISTEQESLWDKLE